MVEFLNGVGKGVEAHAAKLEEAVGGDLQRLLVARTLRLKKLGIDVGSIVTEAARESQLARRVRRPLVRFA